MSAPVLMVQGTGSGVGKSFLVAALCRILKQRGFRVAPFKAQNMSNNAAVTADGGEVGRAQAVQAAAAGIDVDCRMNPVLLKPLADTCSEVIVMGKGRPELRATPWHQRKALLWNHVCCALDSLRSEYEIVVAEGAGSPAETNLRASDIVNMAVAEYASARVLLVADIDRGGAFASLWGTWNLIGDERRHIRGFLLNRFRGDPSLLDPAPRELAERTGVPVLGVVPYVNHLLPEEDGGPLLEHGGTMLPYIGVVALPHASNLDDLDPLRAENGLELRWVTDVSHLAGLSALIIPGTRNTPADLKWLRAQGLFEGIRAMATLRIPIVGLCGGYQLLGSRITDEAGIELTGQHQGLALLDIETVFQPTKTTRHVELTIADGQHLFGELAGHRLEGYEIHHGQTHAGTRAVPWIQDQVGALGHVSGTTWGCYAHGIFRNDIFRRKWLSTLRVSSNEHTWDNSTDRELDRVAEIVAANTNIDHILGWLS